MNKILIRPLRFEDASVSWKWRNDPEVWEHTGSRPDIVVTEEIEKQWILDKLKERNSVRFAIEVDDVYVGNIQLTNIVEKETAEYHVFIGDKSYWGKGVASLATAQIIRYAKNVINLQSLYLSVRPENNSAIRVYEKSGFVKINDDVKMTLDLSKVNAPFVSVFMMAYNHEKYISEAIEGVLMQNTNFDFDIVIGEDCSTDNTRQIILDYQRKYPGKFKLLLHKENIGAMANQMAVLQACTGKYIAICEGDDYWTDPLKLQKQVDFLEDNNGFAICFTNSLIKNEKNGQFIIAKKNIWDVAETKELLTHNSLEGPLFGEVLNSPGHTSTVVFKKVCVDYLPAWLSECFIGDEPLFLIISKYGKAKFINDICTVYRQTFNGISTVNFDYETDYKGRIFMYQKLKEFFGSDMKKDISVLISRYYIKLSRFYMNKKQYGLLLVNIYEAFINSPKYFLHKLLK